MDDIYGNLENYDEVNTITELRSENKDLKLKLAEYATTMDKLQKDFDNLAAEFKKLEYNYSSLLKTARLEIERKTKIITTLNIEKDMMVLNSIQNVNSRSMLNTRRNVTNDRQTFTKTIKEDSDSNIGKAKTNTKQFKDCQKLQNLDTARKEDNQTPSEDMVTSSNTDIKSRLLNIANKVIDNMDSCSERNSDSKENITQNKCGHDDKAKSRALVKNRRKSMPVSSEVVKFSSDEDDSPATETGKKDFPSKDKIDRQMQNRNCYDKECYKKSETSYIDDKNSGYYNISRDMRKGRSSRYYDSDKYRSRDKSSQRYKRHISPERLHRKGPRDCQEERYRYRILESPPTDKYNNYQHRDREHRPDYDRSHAHEQERFRHRHQERVATKHKIPSDYDEPSNKKLRSDSFNRQHEEVSRWHYDKEFKGKQPIEPFDHLQDTSCQSPDYIHSANDAQSMHSIREIRDTAITQLEDPRIASNKYNIRTTHDDNVVLSTVIGRNVDMKPVNKSVWGIKPVDVPDALVQNPLQINEELVKEIYMDIDIENPVSNLSMESGEICFDSEQVTTESNRKGSESNNSHRKHENSECIKPTFDKYKIPKLKQHDKHIQSLDIPENSPISYDCNKNSKEKNMHLICHKNTSKKKMDENHDTINHKYENNKQQEDINIECQNQGTRAIVEGDLELSDETSDYTDFQGHITKQKSNQANSENTEHQGPNLEQNTKTLTATNNQEVPQKSTAKRNTKQDGIEPQGNITKRKVKYQTDNCTIEEGHDQVIKRNTKDQTVNYCNERKDSSNKINTKKTTFIGDNDDAMIDRSKITRNDRDTNIQKYCTEKKIKEESHDESKKSKGKKKAQRHKEINSKNDLEGIDVPHVTDMKTKSKKEKATKPKEIKNRFNDLFGDSCSLITPEDLGLVTEERSVPATEYVPIFEDAQDANDLNSIKDTHTQATTPQQKPENAVLFETDIIHRDTRTEKSNTETSKNNIYDNDKSNINEEPIPVPIDVSHTSNIYSNLNSGISSKEIDVVKTVIISTGIQPQCTVENSVLQDIDQLNSKSLSELRLVNVDEKQNDSKTMCTGLHLSALATSTPEKILQHSDGTEYKIPDSSCYSNESRVACSDSVIPQMEHSDSKTLNSHNDTDVPDVRIVSQSFYRRRRKVVKKP